MTTHSGGSLSRRPNQDDENVNYVTTNTSSVDPGIEPVPGLKEDGTKVRNDFSEAPYEGTLTREEYYRFRGER